MSNEDIKRVTVYFNLKVPSDNKLYSFLANQNDGKRISPALKQTALERVLEIENNVSCETKSVMQEVEPKETKKKLHLSTEDKNNIEGMFG